MAARTRQYSRSSTGRARHSAQYSGVSAPRSVRRLLVGFDLQEVVQDVALLRREVALVSRRVQHCLALIGRHRAQILKCLLHHRLAAGRQALVLLVGLAHLRLLLWRQALKHLAAVEPALPLVLRHLVQLVQLLRKTLLLLCGQPVEVRVIAQQPLLVLLGQIAVLVEPVAKVPRRSGCIGPRRRGGTLRLVSRHRRPASCAVRKCGTRHCRILPRILTRVRVRPLALVSALKLARLPLKLSLIRPLLLAILLLLLARPCALSLGTLTLIARGCGSGATLSRALGRHRCPRPAQDTRRQQ